MMTESDNDPPFDARAFDVFLPQGPEAPLLIDSPHSGRCYPGDFQSVVPALVLRGAEDWMVDDLFGAAPLEGATLLAARFPRAYIDPNRRLRSEEHTSELQSLMRISYA